MTKSALEALYARCAIQMDKWTSLLLPLGLRTLLHLKGVVTYPTKYAFKNGTLYILTLRPVVDVVRAVVINARATAVLSDMLAVRCRLHVAATPAGSVTVLTPCIYTYHHNTRAHAQLLQCQRIFFVYYLRQGGNVFAGFCLFVCLSVSKITQKVMDGSF